jgi:ankyrin repeat protein
MKLLLENGADVDRQDCLGHSTLWHAVDIGLADAAELLMEWRADEDLKARSGGSPRQLALKKGSVKFWQFLRSLI